jgi:pyruvate, water dikinase
VSGDPFILWLDHDTAPGNPLLGGKFANLAEMTAAGFAVPPGFGVSTAAYRYFMKECGLVSEAQEVQQAARTLALPNMKARSANLVEAIASAPMPGKLESAVRANYALLEEKTGQKGVPVAVRSSSESEDLVGASFAGQYDTYLWITGADAVLQNIRACWASMFGEAVLTYRREIKDAGAQEDSAICVGIQQMVEARAAGVMFTLDPLNGDRSKIVMEACWGLGEGVVKGDINPSRYAIDKVTFEVIKREIIPQAEEYRFDPVAGAVGLAPVEAERQESACIDTPEAIALAELAKQIEQRRGAAQDIEWALNQAGDIRILQVRPETVWSQRESEGLVSSTKSPVDHVLARLSGVPVADGASGKGRS